MKKQKILFIVKHRENSSSPSSSGPSTSKKKNLPTSPSNLNRKAKNNSRRQIRIETTRLLRRRETIESSSSLQKQRQQYEQDLTLDANELGGNKSSLGKVKIPRPANAFMIFANKWRKKLAAENPKESNKDISVRLGMLWKSMDKNEKENYFSLAREVDAEHKRKYPDYVYNPKEARIRKAMREQSRDLSRQSVLPTSSSVSSSTGNNSSSNIATSGPVTNNYLNHPIPCASPASTGQVSSSSYNNNRNPWFQIGHNSSANHMKPSIISHRVMPTHQQRIFDKFSSSTNSCYTGDYTIGTTTQSSSVGSGESSSTTNGSVIVGGSSGGGGGLESNDYCGIGEFTEGQKWHPYQNGPTSYHPRMGAMSKLPGRHGMTTTTPHSHNPWSQFCGLPLSSIAAQNGVIRGPRHMLFLQDQQERRCNFPDDISMPYMNNKMDIGHQLPNYSQANYQQDNEKRNEDSLKWENENNDNELRDKNDLLEKEKLKKKDDIKVYNDNNNDVKKIKLPLKSSLPSKQPLPGFHQAFGSTEIGRFSRSEYFANMVGDNGLMNSEFLSPSMFPYSPTDNLRGNYGVPSANEDIIMPSDCYWIGPSIGFPMANMNPDHSKYMNFLDLSHRLNRDWIHPGPIIPHHQDYPPRPQFFYHENINDPEPIPSTSKLQHFTNFTNKNTTAKSSINIEKKIDQHEKKPEVNEPIKKEVNHDEKKKEKDNSIDQNTS
ncbi:uncharacterized protein LOC122849343 [Aphidius gifuensis]|uniref:uncharacterized protein LOC122849343 n=1 Tax=Aphidius gifuensis TaxID=684658 RepID=UPI001CDC91E6|nr:uncharacterized protein LOC122849343 [Aphidius gifuensis]